MRAYRTYRLSIPCVSLLFTFLRASCHSIKIILSLSVRTLVLSFSRGRELERERERERERVRERGRDEGRLERGNTVPSVPLSRAKVWQRRESGCAATRFMVGTVGKFSCRRLCQYQWYSSNDGRNSQKPYSTSCFHAPRAFHRARKKGIIRGVTRKSRDPIASYLCGKRTAFQ